ncbi:MAG: DASS family sodium-coupled anion symporter [Vicinamibacterales bacterium]
MPLADRLAWLGLLLGPALALACYLLIPDADAGGLTSAGRATAGIGVWMAVWWMTEAIPLAATALLPVVAFPLSGAFPAARALPPYASDIVFLFMGGFMIGLAMQKWNLHIRIALSIVRLVGTAPARLVGGFMLATASLSLWISNTAAAVMLMPVGLSVITLLRNRLDAKDPATTTALGNLATCLMLAIAYGASIGGLGTLIGSPPNLVLAQYAKSQLGYDVTMLEWMRMGLPLVALMLPSTWLFLTRVAFPVRLAVPKAVEDEIAGELTRLGPMTRGERVVLTVFACTALAWIFRPQLAGLTGLALSDAVIGMTGALVLFLLPVDWGSRTFALDWHTAERLPWGVLLLFGGGLSLAAAISGNGVDAWLASGFGALTGVRTIWVVLAATTLVVYLTELSSNTAIANTFIPILAAAAVGLGIEPLPVLYGAAFAATCAFMLPVATPPNAIVFGSGYVTVGQMMRAGMGLNIIAIVYITLMIKIFGLWPLPIF